MWARPPGLAIPIPPPSPIRFILERDLLVASPEYALLGSPDLLDDRRPLLGFAYPNFYRLEDSLVYFTADF